MDVPAASVLEVAIADAGLLLVELEKFRAAGEPGPRALRAEAIGLGDRARRLHRTRALDETAATALAAEATALLGRLRATLTGVRSESTYQAAVTAHRLADHGALAVLLPAVLGGVEFVPDPPDLFHAPAWLRRNRPRPPADVVADVARIMEGGLTAEGDALAPGTDPDLPAVELAAGTPPADPVVLRFRAVALPPAVFRVVATDQYLVHVPTLRAPFSVEVPETLDADAMGELSLDHAGYRAHLLENLARAGIAIGRP